MDATPDLISQTYLPSRPSWIEDSGTTVLPVSMPRRRRTLTNSPGQSALSVLGNAALSLIVPVVGFTVLSMNARCPSAAVFASVLAFTTSRPAELRRRTSIKLCSGIPKVTEMGANCSKVTRGGVAVSHHAARFHHHRARAPTDGR